MKLTFDAKADAFTLVFKDEKIVKDVEISENVFAGFNRKGDLVEIQILEASTTEKPWLTVEAAAKYLGKSQKTILRWIEKGIIKPKKVGREFHIKPEDIIKLVA